MSRRLSPTPALNPDVISVRGRGDFYIQREYAFDQAACVRALRIILDAAPKPSTLEPAATLEQYPELCSRVKRKAPRRLADQRGARPK